MSVREHAQSGRRLIAELMASMLPDATRNDLVAKHFELVKYELEAVLHLKNWQSLDTLFQECWTYENAKRWDTLADLALVISDELCKTTPSNASHYQTKILAFLQQVVTKSRTSNNPSDVLKLCRWLRCLYQLALKFDEQLALQCLEQAAKLAKNQSGTAEREFPRDELAWLATTAFNRGVDLYCVQDEQNARLWAEKSMMLAGTAADGGALLKTLQGAYSKWVWQD
jgi:hypothetical protein